MLDRYTMPLLNKAVQPLGQKLAELSVSANSVTAASFLLSLLGCYLIATGYFKAALGLLIIARLGDALDGVIARQTEPTRFGAYLDICTDFVFYSAFVVAFGFYRPDEFAIPALVLVFSFVATGTTFLAFAIQHASDASIRLDLPKKGFYYLGGLVEGTETYIFFLIMLLWPSMFPLWAYIFAILCIVTAFLRVVYAYRSLD